MVYNYAPAYVGFSLRDNNIFSKGVCLLTADEADVIKVSHTFIVVDKNRIIEASTHGVVYTDINRYFDDPHVLVFFKKPKNLNVYMVSRIISRAESHLGKQYDYSLILFYLTYFERLGFLRKYPSIFNNPSSFLCSELVADALSQVKEFSNLFPLSDYHVSKISPMDLFKSPIFKEWKFIDD